MNQKGFSPIFLIVGLLMILLFGLIYFFNPFKQIQQSVDQNKSASKTDNAEMARRTYFKNGQISEVIDEKSKRNSDGSLETVVTSDNQTLSHHLYIRNKIFRLSNGVLTLQESKTARNQGTSYLTTGENILKFISQTPSLQKTTTSLSGKSTAVYTIGGKKSTSFEFIKSVFAQSDDNNLVKVYVDESTGTLKKVEHLLPDTPQPQEVIDYTEGPSLPLLPITKLPEEKNEQTSPPNEPENLVSQLPQLSLEDQLKLIEEQLLKDQAAQGSQLPEGPQQPPAVLVLKEIAEDTKEVKAISVEPAVIPDEAIYLNPLSIIPTAQGYNSLSMELSSTIFNQQARVDREIKEKGVSDNIDFIKDNVKVRIDGVETNSSNINLEPGGSTSLTQPWIIRLAIPKGLTPGYHTVEVYMVDSWYLAPNILVTLPRADEKVLELGLSITPPLVTKLPGNQGYRVVLKGKNLIKPFTVSLDNTIINDTAVAVSGTEELILTIPLNIPPPSKGPAYDVTITKDGQKVFTPSFLLLGGPQPPT